QHPRPVDVERVDLLDRGDADAPDASAGELRVELLARRLRQQIGIVDAAREAAAIEDHRGGDDRPGERRAAGLVNAGKGIGMNLFEPEIGPRHAGSLATAPGATPAKPESAFDFLWISGARIG